MRLDHSFDSKGFPDYESARDYIKKLVYDYEHEYDDEGYATEEIDASLSEETLTYNGEPGHEDDVVAFEMKFDNDDGSKFSAIVKMMKAV